MIYKLSEQQVAESAIYREKWLNIGLSTEPTDIPATEDAVKQCYKSAGLIAPQSIIFTDSPVSILDTIINIAEGVLDQVNDVWDQNSKVPMLLIPKQYSKSVDDILCHDVWHQVGRLFWNQVGSPIWGLVGLPVEDQVRRQIQTSNRVYLLKLYFYNEFLYGRLAFCDYFREVCGLVKETEKVTGLIAISKCCGWWMPRKDFVIIQHRPCFIGFDDDKQLHCDNGMAIKYRDGFGVWAIHGVRADEQIVMKPGEQTVKQITEEKNVEIKRIRIERFGWNRYLTEINAKVIDRRHNDIENTEETLVKTPDGMTILLPTCKTGRLFSLEVPSDVSTCEQAQNWLHSGSLLDTIAGKTRVVGRS